MFPTNFGSFGQAVSEEKMFLEIDQPETRISYSGYGCLKDRDKMINLGHFSSVNLTISNPIRTSNCKFGNSKE